MPNYDLLAASSAATGNLVNAWSTANQNKKSRKFSEQMYNRQKADNLEFWNMQNEYNSPQNQMRRFQEAGLNPNLIYGQGNSGPAGAIQTPDVQSPQFRTPEFGNVVPSGISAISAIYDLDIKAAQADNLKAQNSVILEDALYRAEQRRLTGTQADRAQFDLGFETELRGTSADARRELVRQLRTSTDISMNRDVREALQNSTSIAEAVSRMETAIEQRATMQVQRAQSQEEIKRIRADTARIRENIHLMQKDGRIKELDAILADNSIRPNDPVWYRAAGILMQRLIDWWNE